MRRLGPWLPGVLLTFACAPATGGLGSGSGNSEDETADATGEGDGDGDGDSGDGDGDSGDGDGDSGDGDSGDGDGDSGDGDGDGGCTALGCDCDGSMGSCDEGLLCVEGSCVENLCGDGMLDPGEDCDDGNQADGDGCDLDCSYTTLSVHAGGLHTCALIEGGRVRCWGAASGGQLGYGDELDIGDNEDPASAGDVALPTGAIDLEPGELHTCAVFDDEAVRCWGTGASGQLGYSATADLGDSESLADLAGVMLGAGATRVHTGSTHSCALLDGGVVRCWGIGNDGELGTGTNATIGDNEHPDSVAPAFFGDGVEMVLMASGTEHNCGLTAEDGLYCWGKNNRGQLGYGNFDAIGNDEDPVGAGLVDVYPDALPPNTTVVDLALGKEHSCALFSTGAVLCWGRSNHGQLGQGDTADWGGGADEFPALLTTIDLGGPATAIRAGDDFTCALLVGGAVRCWGRNDAGQLGLGNTDKLGDAAVPSTEMPVDLGGPARSITAGEEHACAVLEDYRVICWGNGGAGRLGYANTLDVGASQSPVNAGYVNVL